MFNQLLFSLERKKKCGIRICLFAGCFLVWCTLTHVLTFTLTRTHEKIYGDARVHKTSVISCSHSEWCVGHGSGACVSALG